MQRVSTLGRRKQAAQTPKLEQRSAPALRLSNDIIFLLAPYDRRVREMHGLGHKTEARCMIRDADSAFTEPHLFYESAAIFEFDLRFYRRLRHLEIRSSKKVYMRSFNGILLDTLELDSVAFVETADAGKFQTRSLKLRNLRLRFDAFISLLCACRPVSLTLDNVECINPAELSFVRLYNTLAALEIHSLDAQASFLCPGRLKLLLEELRMPNFVYNDNENIITYRTRTPYVKFCHILGNPAMPSHTCLKDIDCLCIKGNSNTLDCIQTAQNLKYLKLENATLNGNLVRLLGPLRAVYLVSCAFKKITFYDFISALARSLRFISFKNTEIPLDGLAYMGATLSACQVILSENTQLYIPRKS